MVILLFIATAFFGSSLGRYLIRPVRGIFFPGLNLPHPNALEALYLSLLAGLRGSITIGGIAAAIKLMKYWYIKEQRNLQLQKENAASQLQLLKAQVHPHFLFNTLNNIYSYTQETAPFAAGLITKLSDLLRYVLYEGNASRVLLTKELAMIRDYISLEQVRYGNKLDLDIQFPQHVDKLSVAPLLLLPLVENCFKHGTSHMIDQPWISIHLNVDSSVLHLKLLNGKVEKKQMNGTSGIGILNVQKRLELLYPAKHTITIADDGEVFIVNLKLVLEPIAETGSEVLEKAKPAHA
ncbi:MAG: histidine kinase [Chitinophagaceae bacterium]|nr:MAG: histidine kinase [Chitinophagaceae bacterium]